MPRVDRQSDNNGWPLWTVISVIHKRWMKRKKTWERYLSGISLVTLCIMSHFVWSEDPFPDKNMRNACVCMWTSQIPWESNLQSQEKQYCVVWLLILLTIEELTSSTGSRFLSTFHQATSEGVSHVKFLAKFQHLNFRQFFKMCNFDLVLFWHGNWCESLVWVFIGHQGVSQNTGVLVFLASTDIYVLLRNCLIFFLIKCILSQFCTISDCYLAPSINTNNQVMSSNNWDEWNGVIFESNTSSLTGKLYINHQVATNFLRVSVFADHQPRAMFMWCPLLISDLFLMVGVWLDSSLKYIKMTKEK